MFTNFRFLYGSLCITKRACRFNFNNDGLISKEDIRILLSYVPFQQDESKSPTQRQSSPKNIKGKLSQKGDPAASTKTEGMYNSQRLNFQTRQEDQDEINNFLDQVFGSNQSINYKEYAAINNNVSSEMFCSIMRVLHDNLPCTKNYFMQRRKFRLNLDSPEHSPAKVKEIASPKIVRGLSLTKKSIQANQSTVNASCSSPAEY